MTSPRWTRPALADLAAIDDHYAETFPDHADRTGRSAIQAARFLARYPAAGPVIEGPIRKWRVKGTDYVLVYRVVPAGIEILRVRHGREDWR